MLTHVSLQSLLFIDIETVPEFPAHAQLPAAMQELWALKHTTLRTADDETPEQGYLKRAGVYAEFAKVVCISLGYFKTQKGEPREFRVTTLAGSNEQKLLQEFSSFVQKSFPKHALCGHNIREFDVPFLCRRMLIQQVSIPPALDHSGKKPWEVNDIDTLQQWKFGDYKSFTSLRLIAEVLGIPSPKDEIDGKDVCRVYWQERDLPRIVKYCQKDVVTVARLLLRFKGDTAPLADEEVRVIERPVIE